MKYKLLQQWSPSIVELYLENQWTNYTKNIEQLKRGIENSLDVYIAYDDDKIVGLIRTIGDGETCVYILDLLVRPSYQRQKIGTTLMKKILSKYHHVRQIVLTTDRNPTLKEFYESLGFSPYESLNLLGYYKIEKGGL